MAIAQGFLGELDFEMPNTRKVLERVPWDKRDFKPHEKSGALGWLASHVANLPSWVSLALKQDNFDLQPPGATAPQRNKPIESHEELLATFDRNVAAAREVLGAASDEKMMEPWSLLRGGATLFTIPRVGVIRTWSMNHLIHHRSQLAVYLRLLDVPVPGLYGPTADEPM